MRYADWKKLTDEEKKAIHWRKHPHIRTATIFSIVGALIFALFMLRVFQNKRVHVNRKPNDKEAYEAAKRIVNGKLLLPQTSVFPKSDFTSNIDTAKNTYTIHSTVDTQDSSGKTVKMDWETNMSYQGGDWADSRSWLVKAITIDGKPAR
ncbi:hypothetical protein FPZ42_08495 [Mucilaginibacter achroorhodeus]|uniref:Cytochrome oxidase complex assembly protein 1 n=1 Tax=Mucilaginibacter achroorhodeus TaxID=2599294 RepID=A0A563U6T0_9SPHI|nr:hypothetical protein [Mucilaginibacter achroorhodeus]TWR27061.1 hypothetical protein FPZ42_08495 [Mucilaginibacter achroorhodeus]